MSRTTVFLERRMKAMKTLIRRPALLLVAAFLVVTGFTFANNRISQAHPGTAAPTISVSAHTVRPNQKITITGQGFASHDKIAVFLDQLNYPFGNLTCNGNGKCSGSVAIPLTGPQGQHMILAQGSQPGEAGGHAPSIPHPTIFFNTSQGISNYRRPRNRVAIIGYAFTLN